MCPVRRYQLRTLLLPLAIDGIDSTIRFAATAAISTTFVVAHRGTANIFLADLSICRDSGKEISLSPYDLRQDILCEIEYAPCYP